MAKENWSIGRDMGLQFKLWLWKAGQNPALYLTRALVTLLLCSIIILSPLMIVNAFEGGIVDAGFGFGGGVEDTAFDTGFGGGVSDPEFDSSFGGGIEDPGFDTPDTGFDTGDAFNEFDDSQPFEPAPFGNTPGVPNPENPPDFSQVPPQPQPAPTPTPPTPRGAPEGFFKLFISSIRILDDQSPGGMVPAFITFRNDGTKDLDNLKIAVVVQDLGIRGSEGPFDLEGRQLVTKTVLVELPEEVEPGTYDARITLSNGKERRVLYRPLEVLA